MKKLSILLVLLTICFQSIAQNSVARQWNDVLLDAIREDRVNVPQQARNLFHTSIALFDAWAAYDPIATPFLLGNTYAGVSVPLGTIAPVTDTQAAQEMAMSYAAYRLLRHRFISSPNAYFSLQRFDNLMNSLGYSTLYSTSNYSTGTPADLGNYLAQQIINIGYNDGSNELNNFSNVFYSSSNPSLHTDSSGNAPMTNINNWQPLNIVFALDQGGNPIASTQVFDAPEWGRVTPFALSAADRTDYTKNGGVFPVYCDPGPPPLLDTINAQDSLSNLFKWGHTMVAVWSSHLDPADTTTWDISPNALGNIPLTTLPIGQHKDYYNYLSGGDTSSGYTVNPISGLPYVAQSTKLGDYARVLSQYWADGPDSETPPGHWYSFLNDVSYHPSFTRNFEGVGPTLSPLEWDVKAYFTLGGAMHDAAITAWGTKGWYDSPRPISAIRKMCDYGQSSDSTLPNYHPGGIWLVPNHIELIDSTDALVGMNYENLDKIKIRAWAGFSQIIHPSINNAGVDWILGENWMPYQRETFVSPPFAGYVSGHSTFSRAGAEVLTKITGSEFFPDGLAQYEIPANSGFLFFEKGPSDTVTLEWASYYDASNEAGISRIWGGIHPPFDDMYGRVQGDKIGKASHAMAKNYFSGTVLPIELARFDVRTQECVAKIEWTTSQEKNVQHFELRHGTDGIHFDNLVSKVQAVGNSSSEQTYRTEHSNLEKRNYYKLVEVDVNNKNASVAFSSLIMNPCSDDLNAGLVLYPNPATDKISLEMKTSSIAIERIKILNSQGQLVQESILPTGHAQSVALDLSSLQRGTYFIRACNAEGEWINKKFIKIH